MLDVEAPDQAVLHPVEQLRGVAVAESNPLVPNYVRGQGWQAGGHRPDVQIVNVLGVEQVPAHLIEVDVLRCGFEKDATRVL